VDCGLWAELILDGSGLSAIGERRRRRALLSRECSRTPPMSLASLEAFLERVHGDPRLQVLLADAPDAAAVASIARAAGFPVSELDLWRATTVSPDDLPAAAESSRPNAKPSRLALSAPSPVQQGNASTPPGAVEAPAPASGEEPAGLPATHGTARPPLGRLPDPWLEEEPLSRFVHQAQGDQELREALASAPDAAAVASIARAAGYPISEVDLWLASGTTPDELAASLRPSPLGNRSGVQNLAAAVLVDDGLGGEGFEDDGLGDQRLEAEGLGDAGLEDEGLEDEGFEDEGLGADGLEDESLGAEGLDVDGARDGGLANEGLFDDGLADEGLVDDGLEEEDLLDDGLEDEGFAVEGLEGEGARAGGALAWDWELEEEGLVKDAAALEEAGVDDFLAAALAADRDPRASAATAPDLEPTPQASAEGAILRFLLQAEADAELRQALASAPDAAAVAAIALGAGHPISELALWLASGAAFEEAQPEPEPLSPADDPLTLFLGAVEVDPDLQIALASAPDAATVAAIARIAGFPLTAAELWAASDAVPQELELELEWCLVDEVVVEELVVEERVILGR